MDKIKGSLLWVAVLAVLPIGASAAASGGVSLTSEAGYQFQPRDVRPRVTDRQIQQIVTRIRTDADALRRSADVSTTRGGTYRQPADQDLSYLIDDVVQATDHLADHLDRRQVIQVDVDDVMRRGAELEDAIVNRSSSQQVRNGWSRLRADLDSLASAYGMSWDWRNPAYAPIGSAGAVYQRLTGTYQLDPSRSDDPTRATDQALRQVSGAERTRMARQLQNRLEPPDQISIERVNDQVSLASSRAPRVTFDADGRPQVEPGLRGRNMTSRATMYGDRLEVVTTGGVDTDYTAIFEPLDNGQSLRVTKRLTVPSLRQPVVVRSVYGRTSEIPEWNIYERGPRPTATSGRSYDEIVPDGTTIVAVLDQPLNVRTVQPNDRVTLTVRNAPTSTLNNAVIEGYVTSVPSQVNSAGLSLAFNQIRLSNGRTASFAGTVENVRGPNGEPISFDGEVVDATDPNQRDQAIQRGAIGAAVGAVIGAVVGGAKGAAIGAVVGGGGAAATVLIGNQRSTDLPRGTEFTIRSLGISQ
jgi:hypothetical protein